MQQISGERLQDHWSSGMCNLLTHPESSYKTGYKRKLLISLVILLCKPSFKHVRRVCIFTKLVKCIKHVVLHNLAFSKGMTSRMDVDTGSVIIWWNKL